MTEEEMSLATKVDFRYFISLALQSKMSWEGLAFVLDDLASTLPKSKEIIRALLKELQKCKSTNVNKMIEALETHEQLGIENQSLETEIMKESDSESISDSFDQLDKNYFNVTKYTDQEIQSDTFQVLEEQENDEEPDLEEMKSEHDNESMKSDKAKDFEDSSK